MTVTELYASSILDALGIRLRAARLVRVRKLLDSFFAERLKEYVEQANPTRKDGNAQAN
jgi:hypothetical protein